MSKKLKMMSLATTLLGTSVAIAKDVPLKKAPLKVKGPKPVRSVKPQGKVRTKPATRSTVNRMRESRRHSAGAVVLN